MGVTNPWDKAREIEKARTLKMCLHPEAASGTCAGRVVRAHSVQESLLRTIATDGHVYGSNLNAAALMKNGGKVSFTRIGVNNASTFTGMCGRHDDSMFAPIEKQVFSGTPEQCFLLGYRAICREVFVRRCRVGVIDVMRSMDEGRSPEAQLSIQAYVSAFAHGSQLGTDDLESHKAQYDKVLTGAGFKELKSVILWLRSVPEIMCSSLVYPEYDFAGNQLQLLDSPGRLDLLTYSSIGWVGGGAIVMSWLRDSDSACGRFVGSVLSLPRSLAVHAFVRFLFGFCENIFMAPRWWEGLSEDSREALRHKLQVEASPDESPSPACLADDGLRVANWEIASVQVIGG